MNIVDLSLRQKICSLFIISLSDFQMIPEEYIEFISHLGGIIYFYHKGDTVEMLRDQIAFVRKKVHFPFISVDEEGGRVAKNSNLLCLDSSAPYTLKGKPVSAVYRHARELGKHLKYSGFNLDFAPVADVCYRPENSVVGDRAYSDSFPEAAEMIEAAVKGFRDAGVACTLKHWPGHGGTAEDSHRERAVVRKSLNEMRSDEFLPFISGINAGADMLMTGHITVPAVDSRPASLSSKWINILRDECGFNGVVITDSLKMKALCGICQENELALRALQAGNDMVLMPKDYIKSVQCVIRAVECGIISEDMIDAKLKRINRLKSEIMQVYGETATC